MNARTQKKSNQRSEGDQGENQTSSLNTAFFGETTPIQPHGPPAVHEAELPRWLSVEQIRKMQRMRRTTVITAMLSGELPFEQRGRIRYARLTDVLIWEAQRLQSDSPTKQVAVDLIHEDFKDLA